MGKTRSRFSSLEVGSRFRVSPQSAGAPVRDAGYYMQQALEHNLAGRHEKALTAYSAALGEDPLLLEAWIGQLRMLLTLGESPEARLWADKALAAFPDQPDLLGLKSLAMWRMGLRNDALKLNDTAMGAQRESANVWLARGEMLLATNRSAAMACFEHAVKAAAEPGLTNLRVGDILLEHEHHASALAAFNEAVRRHPDSAWGWYGCGLAQREMGREKYARHAFAQALRLEPGDTRFKAAARKQYGWREQLTRFFARFFGRN